ncbi:MAG TPA: DUF177 domain-containing protein [Acidimicrobiales bacterium]|nr:DUF177 domain-containing protein [Acidimicrobiales bacterium]
MSTVTRSPFLVNVATLRRAGSWRRPEHRRGPIRGLVITGSHVTTGGLVDVDVVLDPIDGGIAVAGTVSAPWVGECRRCLGEVVGEVAVQVHELYEPHHRSDPTPETEEETYLLTGDTVDLEPLAREAVLLNLPQAPLCRSGCAGLCPSCGADLNVGPCGCPPAGVDPRWVALDALRGRDLS